jgi:hypothetical protein
MEGSISENCLHLPNGFNSFLPSSRQMPDFSVNTFNSTTVLSLLLLSQQKKQMTTAEEAACGCGNPDIPYTVSLYSIGTLLPQHACDPEYAQLYFYDPDEALNFHMWHNINLNCNTMCDLQNILRDNHQYTSIFMHSLEVLQRTTSRDLGICIVADPTMNLRRYNTLSADEITVVLPSDGLRAIEPHDIILHVPHYTMSFSFHTVRPVGHMGCPCNPPWTTVMQRTCLVQNSITS